MGFLYGGSLKEKPAPSPDKTAVKAVKQMLKISPPLEQPKRSNVLKPANTNDVLTRKLTALAKLMCMRVRSEPTRHAIEQNPTINMFQMPQVWITLAIIILSV
mmetsp:Transcript_105302/g.186023  ORF Transcript_105302/g.186023 Transcript_105302/m.186023 type:complete len:103 (-) Transcript_105302:247-555(-)